MRINFGYKNRVFDASSQCWIRRAKFVFLCLLISMLSACTAEDEERQASQDRSVEIIPHSVSLRAETTEIQAVGTARAEKTAVILADDGGEVTEVTFQAGDKVNKGDVLLMLELEEERLAVERARVALKNAEQLVARFQGIRLPGAISDSRIDEAVIAAEAARIELGVAELALEKRQVRAPFAGIVGLTDIDAGARITSDTEITRLDDRSILYVDFQAPEEVYSRIVAGDIISIEPFSNAGQAYQATVHKVDSRINQDSRSFTVRAKIDNSADKLRPGMSFKIEFQLPGRSYPVVPEAAIIWGGDGAYVWLAESGVARRVSVTIVSRDAGQVLVRAPIDAGDIVIAEGVQKVREGAKVVFSELYARPQSNDSNTELEDQAAKVPSDQSVPNAIEAQTNPATSSEPVLITP